MACAVRPSSHLCADSPWIDDARGDIAICEEDALTRWPQAEALEAVRLHKRLPPPRHTTAWWDDSATTRSAVPLLQQASANMPWRAISDGRASRSAELHARVDQHQSPHQFAPLVQYARLQASSLEHLDWRTEALLAPQPEPSTRGAVR